MNLFIDRVLEAAKAAGIDFMNGNCVSLPAANSAMAGLAQVDKTAASF